MYNKLPPNLFNTVKVYFSLIEVPCESVGDWESMAIPQVIGARDSGSIHSVGLLSSRASEFSTRFFASS